MTVKSRLRGMLLVAGAVVLVTGATVVEDEGTVVDEEGTVVEELGAVVGVVLPPVEPPVEPPVLPPAIGAGNQLEPLSVEYSTRTIGAPLSAPSVPTILSPSTLTDALVMVGGAGTLPARTG